MGTRGASVPGYLLEVYAVSVAPARSAALHVLARVRRDGAFSGPALAAELARGRLSADDAALATRLTYGTLGAEGVLDEAIAPHVRGALEPRIRDVMRLAAFELLFGRAPAYAVVDQAVDAARRVRPQAAGLVNAVVRRVSEQASSFPWGDPATDMDALARAAGHPRWILDVAIASLGEDAAREMFACGLEPAPTYVRLDPFAGDRSETLSLLAPGAPVSSPPDEDCYLVGQPRAIFASVSAVGWFAMDAAAQLAPRAIAPGPGMRILDVGAGRGNKTVCLQALALRAGGPAAITALDIHEGKTSALARRLEDSGVPGVAHTTGDATDLVALFGTDAFDAVLVDAPCSGLGTLRRYPEKRWRIGPDTVSRMHALQLDLVGAAASVVRPGGVVVYSTCSIAREENADVVDGFLTSDAGRGYALEPLTEAIPDDWGTFRDGRGCFQSWPRSGGPDGHFVALLRRANGDQ